MRTFNAGKVTFEYPDNWEAEKADVLSNPGCIATLSKGQDNLINAVMFPTARIIRPAETPPSVPAVMWQWAAHSVMSLT